jgi:DNA recombination protein RmuC
MDDLQRRIGIAEADAIARRDERDVARSEVSRLTADLARLEATRTERERAHEERATALVTFQASATATIQAFANELLEAKSKSLTESNTRDLGALIDPLKERIAEFKAKVEEVYIAEGKERATLGEQVRALTDLNQAVTVTAQGLTEALKGSSKVQGDWGELVLGRMLESAGLQEGREFVTQESVRDADGNVLRPDVVLTLPNRRVVVIDSKVSLVSWVRYVEATDDDERASASKALVTSVRSHLKGLSTKSYENLHGAGALDFVVLFVPLEGAFAQALATDPALQEDAWKQQVLFAGPTTILFALRTISHLWRQERQQQNAQEIAARAGALIDKIVTFADQFERLGNQLDLATRTHHQARQLLTGGRGNVVRQIEMMQDLGAKVSRRLPATWVSDAEDDGAMPALVAEVE